MLFDEDFDADDILREPYDEDLFPEDKDDDLDDLLDIPNEEEDYN